MKRHLPNFFGGLIATTLITSSAVTLFAFLFPHAPPFSFEIGFGYIDFPPWFVAIVSVPLGIIQGLLLGFVLAALPPDSALKGARNTAIAGTLFIPAIVLLLGGGTLSEIAGASLPELIFLLALGIESGICGFIGMLIANKLRPRIIGLPRSM